jgi:hypothetical protein
MRSLTPLAALLVAACATTPPPAPVTPVAPQTRPSGSLIGLTASELLSRFGQPSFQVREGPGMKLQWVKAGCVLDAYLYPQAGSSGGERVTHVDTRRPSGEDVPQAGCVAALAVR